MFLVLSNQLQSQYANNLVVNGNFATDITGWTNATWETFAWSAGVLSLATTDGTNCGGTANASRFTTVAGTTYRYRFTTTVSGATLIRMDWRFSECGSFAKNFGQIFGNGTYTREFLFGTSGLVGISIASITSGQTATADNIEVRARRDSLWVSPTGTDTAADTVKTLAEAFTTRGAHANGVFVVKAGIYSESVTIDSSFSALVFIGEPTFTQINANSKTFTVDGCYTGTFINDGNVTYINPCASGLRKSRKSTGKTKEYKLFKNFREK